MATISKQNFTRGIFSPVVQSRRDVDAWKAGAKRLTNVTLMKHGGVRKRPGTVFVYALKSDDNEARLFPFTYSPGQSYALLFGQATMRPLALGGAVVSEGFGITAITNANNGLVTAPYHGLTTGDQVFIDGVEGMEEVNGRVFTITVVDANNFRIGANTSAYTPFTGDDGTARVGAPPAPPAPPAVPAETTPPADPVIVPGGTGGGGGGGGYPGADKV